MSTFPAFLPARPIVVMALVSNSALVKTLFNVLIRVAPELRNVYYLFPTLEQARGFLKAELAKRNDPARLIV